MVARGDLGVEVPIEQMAVIQKQMIAKAAAAGKPVITATQMLESMTNSRLPTRAEATDVANAILDGTDCVMLSGESAIGKFPEESVAMLARIAVSAEAYRESAQRPAYGFATPVNADESIASVVEHAIQVEQTSGVFIPTHSGTTARMISRYKPRVWIVAVSHEAQVCAGLAFSFGVIPIHSETEPADWRAFIESWLREHGVIPGVAILLSGPSKQQPDANHRVEFLRFSRS